MIHVHTGLASQQAQTNLIPRLMDTSDRVIYVASVEAWQKGWVVAHYRRHALVLGAYHCRIELNVMFAGTTGLGGNTVTTTLVTRHQGTREWVERLGLAVDRSIGHLDDQTLAAIHPGDCVIGTLPAHLAAAGCERGAEYHSIAVDVPLNLRGLELSADQLHGLGAYLVQVEARRGNVLR